MNLITFSTLACPHWSIESIIARASELGYDGIEWRGGPEGHLQPDMLSSETSRVRRQCSEAGLTSLAITAYTSFTSSSEEERQANVDELRRYAELAAEMGAPYVRVFLGELPEGAKLEASMYANISKCLEAAAEYAHSLSVTIAIEPHDDFVRSSTIAPLLSRVPHPALRVIWDIGNTFAAGEEPPEGFGYLKDHMAYVQVKDGKGRGPNWNLCRLGEGDVPLNQAFELLLANDYQGAFSVEWEYAWHPELDPPEIALPAAIRFLGESLAAARSETT